MTEQFSIVITTTDDIKVAKEIAHCLIASNLAACVQMDKVLSFFKWEENFCEKEEFRLTIKTLSNRFENIEKLIKKYHNYNLPQIIRIDFTLGSKEYLDWIANNS